jgi:hypothetical protein
MRPLLRFAIWLLAIAAVAWGGAALAGWSFLWVFAVAAIAIFVNGLFATLEDDLPGGFNNPDGTATPRYARVVGWVVRGIGLLAGTLAIAMLGLHFLGAK